MTSSHHRALRRPSSQAASLLPSFLFPLLLLLLATASPSLAANAATPDPKSQQTLQIKDKLRVAEGRVSELISRLDSVSDDASRAKNDIHNTLNEVWKVVDLLGSDQCGSAVEEVRVQQRKAESRSGELEEVVAKHLKTIESLRGDGITAADSLAEMTKLHAAEKERREKLEAQSKDLGDKLRWAYAAGNETKVYKAVSERMKTLVSSVVERNALLKKGADLIAESQTSFGKWQTEVDGMATMVRDAERDFSSGVENAAVDGLKKQILGLERRLKDVVATREDATRERDALRKSVENLQGKVARGGSVGSAGGVGGGARATAERIVTRGGETGWFGWLAFGLLSLCTGGVLVTVMGVWTQRGGAGDIGGEGDVGASDGAGSGGKFGFSPQGGRASPDARAPTISPLTHVNGSGNRTPGSRGSTPRRY